MNICDPAALQSSGAPTCCARFTNSFKKEAGKRNGK